MAPRLALALLFGGLLATRLCHAGIVWVEEAYPTAAAIQMLDGKVLYRDVWFDKPPLFPALYVLWDARTGVPLRIAGAVYIFLACLAAWRFASELWGPREGIAAACFLGFFLTFGIPSAVMALAPDLLMILPHLAAVYLAWKSRPFLSGVAAGVALLLNSKGVFVLAACAIWQWRALPLLAAGFVAPNAIAVVALWFASALPAYWQQVWVWGWLYSKSTFLEQPFRAGLLRTLDWAGFQAALVLGAAWFWWRDRSASRWRFALWAAVAFAGVIAGWRFFPRYYFLLLPPMAIAAARGYTLLGARRVILLIALLVPLLRFGPRFAALARDLATGRETRWPDLAMSEDSRRAARIVESMARPGDTLLVWGYRPDVFADTRLPAGTRFLDSQPLTGVLADRHLTRSDVIAPELAARNRLELTHTAPTFIVDGLGPYNPRLVITAYPNLAAWLAQYDLAARTQHSVIFRRRASFAPAH
ncbi:MAG: hypothetical protein ACRD9L_28150 [Bryobacteraceae bacterium]